MMFKIYGIESSEPVTGSEESTASQEKTFQLLLDRLSCIMLDICLGALLNQVGKYCNSKTIN